MSPIFKSQKLMLSLMALTLLALLLSFSYLRISAKIIDFPTYQTLLHSGTLHKAFVEEKEVTLYAHNERYIIIKDGIDIAELLKKVPIEVKTSNPMVQDLILLGILMGTMVVLLL